MRSSKKPLTFLLNTVWNEKIYNILVITFSFLVAIQLLPAYENQNKFKLLYKLEKHFNLVWNRDWEKEILWNTKRITNDGKRSLTFFSFPKR